MQTRTPALLAPIEGADHRKSMVKKAKLVSYLLDGPRWWLPFGFDPVLGFFTFAWGDLVMLASAYIPYVAYRLGAPKELIHNMAWNIAMDLVISFSPVIGDLVGDVAWRANARNLALLETWLNEAK